ncbi:MAG TPA: ROK family protein [Bacilli bacterium]|nr:ROK family protein [Bacilli bacterium]
MKYKPSLDKDFTPIILEINKYKELVASAEQKQEIIFCIERNNNYNYFYTIETFVDGSGHDDDNFKILERILKSLLWIVGGYKIYVSGSKNVYTQLQKTYCQGGIREFDFDFMSVVYEKPFEIIYVEKKDLPAPNFESVTLNRDLVGCRIGFDAGGSDRKVSAVVDGEVLFSEETVWYPKITADPEYHYQGILESMKKAASYMSRVDAIGVSSAGIYVNNKIMVASLFLKVSKEDFNRRVKTMYIDVAKEFGDVPLVVANDGDVTALAGAMELNDNQVLGIAMGTSEAAGYVDEMGKLKGWLNELAFVPIDLNKDAMIDEWSLDHGCGVKYFSQDGVIKLAKFAGIELDEDLAPAKKLKIVQDLNEAGDPRANEIFENIGIYLGYTLAYYAHFYSLKHVLLLGRVVSGKGGNTLLEVARSVLHSEFPELSHVEIMMPDEKNRRVGQSIAAASLPKL